MPHPPPAAVPDRHADHDPLLVSAYAAGDATGRELDEALALVAACADCAGLHRDLRAITAATATLPAPVRTRDFRLTPEQAASLRPAGWRRFLAPFAGPRFSFAAPLGTALATLGLASILVSGGVGLPLAGSTASMAEAPAAEVPAAVGEADEGAPSMAAMAAPAPSAAPVTQRDAAVSSPLPADLEAALRAKDDAAASAAGAATGMAEGARAELRAAVEPPPASFPSAVPGLALAALAAGLLLVSLRLIARRTA